MIEDIKSHFWHYLILIVILCFGTLVFVLYPQKIIRFKTAGLVAVAYICWGIIHHLSEKNLNLKIVVEYALIGALGIALLGGLLL